MEFIFGCIFEVDIEYGIVQSVVYEKFEIKIVDVFGIVESLMLLGVVLVENEFVVEC